MKSLLVGVSAAAVAFARTGGAADMGMPMKAPAPPPPPVYIAGPAAISASMVAAAFSTILGPMNRGPAQSQAAGRLQLPNRNVSARH